MFRAVIGKGTYNDYYVLYSIHEVGETIDELIENVKSYYTNNKIYDIKYISLSNNYNFDDKGMACPVWKLRCVLNNPAWNKNNSDLINEFYLPIEYIDNEHDSFYKPIDRLVRINFECERYIKSLHAKLDSYYEQYMKYIESL